MFLPEGSVVSLAVTGDLYLASGSLANNMTITVPRLPTKFDLVLHLLPAIGLSLTYI